ncbi:MAG: formylglycine-generating enzyme family protein [Acidobacteria bacterium]|nr:formylglycine-generating enzyme family protein [Acidobacteriota bacterium]
MSRVHKIIRVSALLSVVGCSPSPPPTPAPPPDMVIVPASWFGMGRDDGPRANQPHHLVYISAIAIDRTEVTQAAFAAFVTQTGYQPKRGWTDEAALAQAAEPVVGVVWAEADAYCRWAGKRLPTEAEWEKAARGTDGRLYPWGNAWDPAKANTLESGLEGVRPVGSFPEGASPYGALDMAGNAAEWVADYFDFTYYIEAPDHDPTGPTKVLDHVVRGGSWASPPAQVQTFFRDSSHSVEPNMRLGFRCAMSVPGDSDSP